MLRCSFAALSRSTLVAAIAKAARTINRCLRGHREKKRSALARVSTVGARGSKRADFLKTSTSSCSLYDGTKYAWLQYKIPQIQAPGTTFSNCGDEVGMERDHRNWCRFATLTPESTKGPISALPNFGSKEKSGARAELRDIVKEKLGGRGGSSCRFDCLNSFFRGHCNTGGELSKPRTTSVGQYYEY